MRDYLAVDTVLEDELAYFDGLTVTGSGPFGFTVSGVSGPWGFDFGGAEFNRADAIFATFPSSLTHTLFARDNNNQDLPVGLFKFTEDYATAYWSVPFEALSSVDARDAAMDTILRNCSVRDSRIELAATGDGAPAARSSSAATAQDDVRLQSAQTDDSSLCGSPLGRNEIETALCRRAARVNLNDDVKHWASACNLASVAAFAFFETGLPLVVAEACAGIKVLNAATQLLFESTPDVSLSGPLALGSSSSAQYQAQITLIPHQTFTAAVSALFSLGTRGALNQNPVAGAYSALFALGNRLDQDPAETNWGDAVSGIPRPEFLVWLLRPNQIDFVRVDDQAQITVDEIPADAERELDLLATLKPEVRVLTDNLEDFDDCEAAATGCLEVALVRPVTVTVALTGPLESMGWVDSAQGGLVCTPGAAAGDCDLTVDAGTRVTLTVRGTSGSARFVKWEGAACNGDTGSSCVFTVDDDITVTAAFGFELSVAAIDNGDGVTGRIISQPPGIDCPVGGSVDGCSANFLPETPVTLVALLDGGGVFEAWSSPSNTTPCIGSVALPQCQFTLFGFLHMEGTFVDGNFQVQIHSADYPSSLAISLAPTATTADLRIEITNTADGYARTFVRRVSGSIEFNAAELARAPECDTSDLVRVFNADGDLMTNALIAVAGTSPDAACEDASPLSPELGEITWQVDGVVYRADIVHSWRPFEWLDVEGSIENAQGVVTDSVWIRLERGGSVGDYSLRQDNVPSNPSDVAGLPGNWASVDIDIQNVASALFLDSYRFLALSGEAGTNAGRVRIAHEAWEDTTDVNGTVRRVLQLHGEFEFQASDHGSPWVEIDPTRDPTTKFVKGEFRLLLHCIHKSFPGAENCP